MVRTAPVTAVAPDALRAMERLESQLRRAADDLAETLAAVREVATMPLPLPPEPLPDGSRCGRWMPRVGAPCARFAGHGDHHRTRRLMDVDAARRSERRAQAHG